MSDLELTLLQDSSAPPRTYLWWAIAATAFCFAPFGLVAIWFGYRSLRAFEHEDPDAAQRASRIARRWLIITVIVGFIVNLLLLLIFGFMGAFST